jgi:hypothetical protein
MEKGNSPKIIEILAAVILSIFVAPYLAFVANQLVGAFVPFVMGLDDLFSGGRYLERGSASWLFADSLYRLFLSFSISGAITRFAISTEKFYYKIPAFIFSVLHIISQIFASMLIWILAISMIFS